MKTIVFDFDGVIHSYTSGWKGYGNIPDPPVEGIADVLRDLRHSGYKIAVVSARSSKPEGLRAINEWLENKRILQYVDLVSSEKPPAVVYVDDRAICFDGETEGLAERIKTFRPWTTRENRPQ